MKIVNRFFFSVVVFSVFPLSAFSIVDLLLLKFHAVQSPPSSNIVVSRQQLLRNMHLNVDSILRELPFLQVSHFNGEAGSTTYSLSGFGATANQNTAVTLDGQRWLGPAMDIPSFAQWNLHNLAKITVEPGSQAVVQGGGAVGGVINLRTLSAADRQSWLDVGGGAFGSRHAALQWVRKNKAGGFYLNGGYNESDGFRQHNHSIVTRLATGMSGQHQNTRWRWDFSHDEAKVDFPGALSAAQVQQNPRQAQNDRDYNRRHADELRFSWGRRQSTHWDYQLKSRLLTQRDDGILISPYKDSGDYVSVDPSVNMSFSRLHAMMGVDYHSGFYRFDNATLHSSVKQSEFGLYNQNRWRVGPWSVVFGGRYGYLDGRLNQENPLTYSDQALINDIGLQYHMARAGSVTFRRAESYRFPTADEMGWTEQHVHLKPQEGVDYRVIYAVRRALWQVGFQAYNLVLHNEITYLPFVGSQQYGYNTNLSQTRRRGVSGWLKWMGRPWGWMLGVDYVDPSIIAGDNRGKEIPFVSHWHVTAAANFVLSQRWSLHANLSYLTQRFVIGDTSNLGPEMGDQMTSDVGLTYCHRRWRWSVMMNNVFNQHRNSYAVMQLNHQIYYYPAPGRSLFMSLFVKL